MKAVFTAKLDSRYDDVLEERYHFPRTYRAQVTKAVGDLIVYYEPRRTSHDVLSGGGRQAYFAIAQLDRVEIDPRLSDHFYGFVSNYLDFDRPVPFRENGAYYESALRRDDGETNRGAFGRAVRNIPDHEFEAILAAGFDSQTTGDEWRAPAGERLLGFAEPQAAYDRPQIESVTTRSFRDQAFKRHVRDAYRQTCAMTGLRILNGGGKPEVEAAHIRPVAEFGTDSVRNGIALSRTVHWMFDRGLLSIDDDLRILTADSLPEQVRGLLNVDGRVLIPENVCQRPHSQFLSFHRETIFKGWVQ